MSEQDNAFLRTEISRLSRLVEALLSANEDLRREISVLKGTDAPPNQVYSIEHGNDGTPKSNASIVHKSDGTPIPNASIAHGSDGTHTPNASIVHGSDGTPMSIASIVHGSDGTTNILYPLPSKIELSGMHTLYMRDHLKTGKYIKVSDTNLQNQIKLLINFYNGGSGSHKELRKLTGLSKGGMAKSIMALTKRGLIVRTGFQKFSLTGDALKILESGWQNFSKYSKPAATNT